MSSEVPDGWQTLAFSEAVAINPKRMLTKSGAVPFLDMASLPVDGAPVRVRETRALAPGGSKFQVGDTLFARITPCAENGKLGFVSGIDGAQVAQGSTEFIVMGARDGLTLPEYVRCLSGWSHVRDHAIGLMEGTSGRQRIPVWAFDEIEVGVPPLDEQRRIAEILRSVDEAIAANEAALVNSQALVGKLAGDVITGTAVTTKMASLGKIITGRTPSPKQVDLWNGDLPFVTPGDLVAGNVSVTSAARTINAESRHGATVLPANAVLVTCIGSTVGKTAIARQPCATNQQINAICCAPQIAGFVYLACVAAYNEIVAKAGKQAVPIINKSTFASIEVPAMNRAEMVRVSELVDALDGEIGAVQATLDALCRTKATLMSDLLSGRVRVPA